MTLYLRHWAMTWSTARAPLLAAPFSTSVKLYASQIFFMRRAYILIGATTHFIHSEIEEKNTT